MMKFLKAFLSFSMCFVYTSNTICCALAEEEQKPIIEEITPREAIQRTKVVEYTDTTINRSIAVNVTYTTRYEESNSTGKYITGILSLSANNTYGSWYRVGSCTMTSVSYGSNHQVAYISFTYQASLGAGYATYSGGITLQA